MRAATLLFSTLALCAVPARGSTTPFEVPGATPSSRDLTRDLVVGLAAPTRDANPDASIERWLDLATSLGLVRVATLGRSAQGLAREASRSIDRNRPGDRFDLDPSRVILLRAPDAASARRAAARLSRDPAIEWLEPDFSREAADFPLDGSLPDDPLLRDTRQWFLWNAGSAGVYRGLAGADLGAREAWKQSCGSNDVILAVVDTGVDPMHPDLQRRMPDGTSRVTRGANVTLDGSNSWADSAAHGTAVAGVMAALTHDGAHFDSLGVAGVCGGDGRDNAGCRLVPVKIAPGHSTSSSSFELASGIVWAVDAGARVINLSFAGNGDSGLERRALQYALRRGAVVVAAAGNRGLTEPTRAQYPAAYAAEGLCIQVGASDAWDRRAAFSSYGPGLDLVAPGVELWTTAPTYPFGAGSRYPGYLAGSGTSFAAPCVTGAAGLLLARRPELSDTDLQHVLRESARDVAAPGVDPETAWGRLDAAAALRAIGPEVGILHEELPARIRGTGIFGTLAAGSDSFGSFDHATLWMNREAELVEASVTFALPDSFRDGARVWTRVSGTMALRDGFRPPRFIPWAEVSAREGRRVTLRGWLYRLPAEDVDGEDDWLPLPPDQARIAFTVLGVVDRSPRLEVRTPPPAVALSIAPNPVRGAARVSGPPGSGILLCDLAGRVVRRARLDPERGTFEWDGRDQAGRRARPGLYFLRDEGVSAVSRSGIRPLRFVVLE